MLEAIRNGPQLKKVTPAAGAGGAGAEAETATSVAGGSKSVGGSEYGDGEYLDVKAQRSQQRRQFRLAAVLLSRCFQSIAAMV